MSAIAIIPARGGSRRIPRKNIRSFHGKPILSYSIEGALESGLFERVVVSTDDREIAHIALAYGAQVFMRPTTDNGARGTQEVTAEALAGIREVMYHGGWDLACCIYATAPLMRVGELECARDIVANASAAYCYAVHKWRDAGQWYFGSTEAFLEGVPLDHWSTIRIDVGANRYCDINTEADWLQAEQMYLKLKET